MKTLTRAAAVGVFLLHCVVGVIIFFGWLWPSIWPVYLAIITITLFQNWLLGYCILSRMEFSLRRMLDPTLRYDYSFASYYTYKLTRQKLSVRFVQVVGTFFLLSSIALTMYFRVA